MTLFISSSSLKRSRQKCLSKALLPLMIALVSIACIELSILGIYGADEVEKQTQRSALLELNYLKTDVGQKYIVGYKNALFYKANADFIQIGDSSGAYGIRPRVIESHLGGKSYISSNCCADIGWQGYVDTAEYFLKHNEKDQKYLVLAVTPYSMPGQFGKGFSEDFQQIYNSPWAVFHHLPSLSLRQYFTHYMYYAKPYQRESEYQHVMNDVGVVSEEVKASGLNLYEFTAQSGGWQPYGIKEQKKDMPVGQCGPGISNFYTRFANGESIMVQKIKEIFAVTQKYNAELIVVFNPVACQDNEAMLEIKEDIRGLATNYPEIIFPLPFIQTMPEDQFSDQWHLHQTASVDYSHKLGNIFQEIIEHEESR